MLEGQTSKPDRHEGSSFTISPPASIRTGATSFLNTCTSISVLCPELWMSILCFRISSLLSMPCKGLCQLTSSCYPLYLPTACLAPQAIRLVFIAQKSHPWPRLNFDDFQSGPCPFLCIILHGTLHQTRFK